MEDGDNGRKKYSEGIKTLLGDPKKAIVKLSLPMIVAMSAQTIYNLVDAIWVSGLGAGALAAIGFVYPFLCSNGNLHRRGRGLRDASESHEYPRSVLYRIARDRRVSHPAQAGCARTA